MAQVTISLPSLIMTSSAFNSSTQTIPAVDVSDAISLSAIVNGNTSAPGLILEGALTTESTAIFAPIVYDSSGSTVVNISSAKVIIIPVAVFKQVRIASTNTTTSTSYTVLLAKSMHL